MKKLLLLFLIFSFTLSYAQEHSTGIANLPDKPYKDSRTEWKYNRQTTGYGSNGIGGDWYSIDIPGGGLTSLGSQNFLMQGADFAGDTYYAINGDTGELITVNTADGTVTVVGTVTGVTSGQTITALGYDESTNTMYLGTTDITTSELYTINLNTAEASLIGATGQAGLIAMLVTCDGAIYTVDLVDDMLWSVDPGTGAGTPVGALGYDVNFAQDADVDASTGKGYLAAYNNGTSSGQLREVNFATGHTTMLVDWGGVEITGFGINETCGPPCPVGDPTNPNPPNGANDVSANGTVLSWSNAPDADEIEVFFGPAGNVVSVYQGLPITSYNPGTLDYNTNYYWHVNQIDTDIPCTNTGPPWYFTTMQDPNLGYWLDDFSDGLINWEVTNDGGDCVWDIFESSRYELPYGSSGNVAAADADACGSGTTTITTMTLDADVDVCAELVIVEWDNDFRVLDSEDEAYVELSTDNGVTWETVWSQVGSSVRNSHEEVNIFTNNYYSPIKVRFKSIQPGWDWWWAIDNVKISSGWWVSVAKPTNLTADFQIDNTPQVNLSWQDNANNESGTVIERKLNDSSGSYNVIKDLQGENYTQFTDTTVQLNLSYVYRIKAYTYFNGERTYSCYSNIAEVETIIPVELISFTANIIDNKVKLNWKTATEINNQGFEIQRSQMSDVKRQINQWEKIGFVDGNGTTSEEQSYSFVDDEQLFGKYKYRLKQIDYDGSYEYSNEVEVDLGMPKEFSLEQNYPNPFNPITIIKFTIPETGLRSPLERGQRGVLTKLTVYDILGNEIVTLVNENKEPGIHEVEFNASNLSSGIYFYRLQAKDFIAIKKMILLR